MFSDNEAKQRQAFEAVIAHAHRSFVGLVCEVPHFANVTIASGTALRAGSRVVVLTAAHNVETDDDVERLALHYFHNDTVFGPRVEQSDLLAVEGGRARPVVLARVPSLRLSGHSFIEAVHRANGFDVALLEVRPDVEATLLRIGVLRLDDAIAPLDDCAVLPTEMLFALGMPSQLSTPEVQTRSLGLQTFATFAHANESCVAEGHVSRGIHFGWREAHDLAGSPPRMHPRGMSGGALWRIRSVPGVWSAEKAARIVGVPSYSFPDGDEPHCERCEAVADFGPWLFETVARMKGTKPL